MRMMKHVAVALAALSVVALGACTLDIQNPNQPTQEQVTTSPDGVIALV